MTPSAHSIARRLILLVRKTPFRRFLTAYPRLRAGSASVRVPVRAGLGTTNLDLSEPWMFELLRRLLGAQMGTFVDVGVNMGQTLLKVLLLDPTRRYVGFEPNPLCVYYANLIIQANGAKRATLCPAACRTMADSSRFSRSTRSIHPPASWRGFATPRSTTWRAT